MCVGALHSVRHWRRLRLLILIILAGTLVLLIAPSSAVLLQPRYQTVPAGGTAYFLPAAPDQLWPSEVNGSDELSECFGMYSAQNIVCASAGFDSLRSYFQNFNTSFTAPRLFWDNYVLRPILIQSLAGTVPRLLNSGIAFRLPLPHTFWLQPNAVTAIFQEALTNDWREGSKRWSGSPLSTMNKYQYATHRLSSVVSISPVVLPRCLPAQNMSTGPGQVSFPVKTWAHRTINDSMGESPEWEDESKDYNVIVPEYDTTHSLQHQLIHLPTHRFGPVSGGLLLELPGTVPNASRVIVACSISAFWSSGQVLSDSLVDQAAYSFAESKIQRARIRADLNASNAEASKSRRLISIRDDWFRSLTPPMPCVSHSNQSRPLTTLQCLFSEAGLTTFLENIRTTQLQPKWNGSACQYQPPDPSETDVDRWNRGDCGNGAKQQLLEMILASVFANGLSRYGSRHAFDQISIRNSPHNPWRWLLKSLPRAPDYYASLLSNKPLHDAILPAPASASNYVTLRMRVQVLGYAWYASGFSEYFAIAVVVMYMLIALVHTIWVVSTGVTSSSWDTVTELLALALQSPVSKALKGSGAGIERLGTYQRIMKLRVREEGQEEKVILVVDEDGNDTNIRSSPSRTTGLRYRKVEIDKDYT
ncbi:MAG: hypothetical protein Q9205_002560 [Flavoplaca limonia]